MNEINFDVNKIIKISFHKEKLITRFLYVPESKKKRFLGLLSDEIIPEHYVDMSNPWHSHFSASRIASYGFKLVSLTNDISGKQLIYEKASVFVYLDGMDSISRIFEDDESASDWVSHLKDMSEKRFETFTI